MAASDRLVWIDCEMTGLDLGRDMLCEIACIVTEADLTPIDEGISIVIRPSDESLAGMPEVVREMHTVSGLLPLIPGGVSAAEAQRQVLEYVKSHVPEERKAPLCGSTIYVDRMFLAREMPELDNYLHYRVIDVSSIKELTRRWYPKAYYSAPEKTGGHRALGDILDSLAELRHYRETVLTGPTDPDAASISAPGTATTGAEAADPGV